MDYIKLSAEKKECMHVNRQLLSQVADLKIENATLKRELELYKAFSTDVSHELVARELRKGNGLCRK